jgi:hypothetical protein
MRERVASRVMRESSSLPQPDWKRGRQVTLRVAGPGRGLTPAREPLYGSPYRRHGFAIVGESEIHCFMERRAQSKPPTARLWAELNCKVELTPSSTLLDRQS